MNNISDSLEIETNRSEIRQTLEQCIKTLTEEKEIPIKEIVAEMLLISSIIISADKEFINNESIKFSSEYDDNEEDLEDDDEEDFSYEVEDAKGELKYLKKEVKKFSKDIEKRKVNSWDISGIPERIEECVDNMEDEVVEILKDEILKLKESVIPLVNKAEIIWAEIQLEETAERLIHNISSIKSILSELKEVEVTLKDKDILTTEREELIKKTKEKCAIYRASKKMLDFEIADNSGNTTKAHKLKAEANALLMQDWDSIIKNNNYPDVADLKP